MVIRWYHKRRSFYFSLQIFKDIIWEAYFGPCYTSAIEILPKEPLTIFAKKLHHRSLTGWVLVTGRLFMNTFLLACNLFYAAVMFSFWVFSFVVYPKINKDFIDIFSRSLYLWSWNVNHQRIVEPFWLALFTHVSDKKILLLGSKFSWPTSLYLKKESCQYFEKKRILWFNTIFFLRNVFLPSILCRFGSAAFEFISASLKKLQGIKNDNIVINFKDTEFNMWFRLEFLHLFKEEGSWNRSQVSNCSTWIGID